MVSTDWRKIISELRHVAGGDKGIAACCDMSPNRIKWVMRGNAKREFYYSEGAAILELHAMLVKNDIR